MSWHTCSINYSKHNAYAANIVGIVDVNQTFHVPKKDSDRKFCQMGVKLGNQFNIFVNLIAGSKFFQVLSQVVSVFFLNTP